MPLNTSVSFELFSFDHVQIIFVTAPSALEEGGKEIAQMGDWTKTVSGSDSPATVPVLVLKASHPKRPPQSQANMVTLCRRSGVVWMPQRLRFLFLPAFRTGSLIPYTRNITCYRQICYYVDWNFDRTEVMSRVCGMRQGDWVRMQEISLEEWCDCEI